jgi:AcrR family transcriptional regulator
MSKQTLLIASLQIFAHFGVKNVSMSQIANTGRVSKRTLYTYFNSKEELLEACLEYEDEHVAGLLLQIERRTQNPVERLVRLTNVINRYRASFCPAFYKDVVCFHNANLKLNVIYRRIRERLVDCFNDGREKGLFLPERNYEVIASVLMEQVVLQHQGQVSPPHRSTAFQAFLRGLCTEKGRALLDVLPPQEQEENDSYGYEYNFQ